MIDARDLPTPDHPLQKAARAVHEVLPDRGFIIITAPFLKDNQTSERADYVSNINRDDAIAVLKTVLFRWGINDEWMKCAK